MHSYLMKYIERTLNIWQKTGHAEFEDAIESVFAFLTAEVNHTGNYFTELVEIAELVKNCQTFQIVHFREALKAKILKERGEDGLNLIKKFYKE